MINTSDTKFSFLTRGDYFFLFLLVIIGIHFILDFQDFLIVGERIHWDLNHYIKMAENPSVIFTNTIPGHYCQRIFPSLLVWFMHTLFGISVKTGFCLLSRTCLLVTLFSIYFILRNHNVHPTISFGTAIYSLISQWPMTYYVYNIYQATDALSFPLALLLIFLTIKERYIWLFLISLIGILTRQDLFVLSLCAFVYLFLTKHNFKILIFPILLIIFFHYTSIITQAYPTLIKCSFERIYGFEGLFNSAMRTGVIFLFSPFLFILFTKETFTWLKKYWWIVLFCILIIIRMLLKEDANISHCRKLFFGIWLIYFPVAIVLNRYIQNKWLQYAYAFSPVLYGLSHLDYKIYTFPSLIGNRHIMNFIILGILMVGYYRIPQRIQKFFLKNKRI